MCRIYNENDDVETSYRDDADDPALKPLKRFSEVAYLHSTSQTNPFNNILVGTEHGQLQMLSTTPAFLGVPMSRFNLHHGEVSRILLSPDGKYLISGGADGTIFVMTMTDLASEPIPGVPVSEKPTVTTQSSVQSPSKVSQQPGEMVGEINLLSAEEQLSEIVLVRKSLMESWRKR